MGLGLFFVPLVGGYLFLRFATTHVFLLLARADTIPGSWRHRTPVLSRDRAP